MSNIAKPETLKADIVKLLDKFIAESVAQESKTDTIGWLLAAGKMAIKPIEVESLKRFPDGYVSSGYSANRIKFDNIETVNRYCEIGIKHVNSILKEAERQHEANIPAIENNNRIINGVFNLMERLGVSKEISEYTYKTTRHRSKEWVKRTADWPSEVRYFVPTNDGFAAIEQKCKVQINEIEKWKKDRLAEIELAERKNLIEKQKAEEHVLFYKLCAKYDIVPTPQVYWENVIEKIINKVGSVEDLSAIKRYFHFDEDDY